MPLGTQRILSKPTETKTVECVQESQGEPEYGESDVDRFMVGINYYNTATYYGGPDLSLPKLWWPSSSRFGYTMQESAELAGKQSTTIIRLDRIGANRKKNQKADRIDPPLIYTAGLNDPI